MKLKPSLPVGLKNNQCEWFDPSCVGGLPPVRFVPSLLSEKEVVVYLASNFLCVKNIQGDFFCCFEINFS